MHVDEIAIIKFNGLLRGVNYDNFDVDFTGGFY